MWSSLYLENFTTVAVNYVFQEIVFFLLVWETDLAEEADYHENVTSGLYLVVIVQYIRCCSV